MPELLPSLEDTVAFLTSKTGIFAAIVALLGLVTSVYGFSTNIADRRKARAKSAAEAERASQGLELVDVSLGELSLSANSYDLQFVITNTGSKRLVMRQLTLEVVGRSEVKDPIPTVTMAPLTVHKHRVEFRADKDSYDVRGRTFGKGSEPLQFDPGELEAFLVKLISDEDKVRYRFYVQAQWYEAQDPDAVGEVRSTTITAEFPERVSSGPPDLPVG